MKMTREQIINLINQYIYTNGQELITGEQLNEILIVIANAFAMEGEASSGIDAVLEKGSLVSEGREIINGHGGQLKLSKEELANGILEYAMGFVVEGEKDLGLVDIRNWISIIGNIHTEEGHSEALNFESSISNSVFASRITSKEDVTSAPESFTTGSVYVTRIAEKSPFRPGAHTIYYDSNTQSMSSVDRKGITSSIFVDDQENLSGTFQNIGMSSYSLQVQSGDSRSELILDFESQKLTHFNAITKEVFAIKSDVESQTWSNQNGQIAVIGNDGFKLENGKKLELGGGGEDPTAGKVTLVEGRATIMTEAVQVNSVINLTVQAGGTFSGGIRVLEVVAGESFTISSARATDTCVVFWQIISLI